MGAGWLALEASCIKKTKLKTLSPARCLGTGLRHIHWVTFYQVPTCATTMWRGAWRTRCAFRDLTEFQKRKLQGVLAQKCQMNTLSSHNLSGFPNCQDWTNLGFHSSNLLASYSTIIAWQRCPWLSHPWRGYGVEVIEGVQDIPQWPLCPHRPPSGLGVLLPSSRSLPTSPISWTH